MSTSAITCVEMTKRFTRAEPLTGGTSASTGMWAQYLGGLLWNRRADAFTPKRENLTAVDHLCLEIARGEFFGLLGSNGAGKTTLVKMLATVLSPTEGTAIVNGYDIRREGQMVRRSTAVVSTGGWLGFDLQLSIGYNLRYWAEVSGLNATDAHRRTTEVLELIGLADKANESSSVLSSGMRQRLAIAKGLLLEAPVMLMDEPTIALDPASANDIRQFLKSTVNGGRGATIILTTQNMLEADQLCERVAILDRGQIILSGSPWVLKQDLNRRVVYIEASGLTHELTQCFQNRFRVRHGTFAMNAASGRNSYRFHFERAGHPFGEMKQFLEELGVSDLLIRHAEPTLEDVYIQAVQRGVHSNAASE